MYQPSQGQIEYIRGCIQSQIRPDGRTNMEIRDIIIERGILAQADGSALVKLDSVSSSSAVSIYVGIKVELGKPSKNTPNEGIINLQVDSMKRNEKSERKKQNVEEESVNSDEFTIGYAAALLRQNLIDKIDKTVLGIMPGEKCWVLNIDVFLLNYVHLCYIEMMGLGIRAALIDLKVPEIQTIKNQLTDEIEVEINDDKMISFFAKDEQEMPIIFTIGEQGGQLVFDLSLEQYYSVDTVYIASVTTQGVLQSLLKTGSGYLSPQTIFQIVSAIQKAGTQLFEFQL